jgi:hypothetical protein
MRSAIGPPTVDHDRIFEALKQRGWEIRLLDAAVPIPAPIEQRFPWLPRDVRSLVENVATAVSADQRAWFVTATVLTGESDVAFSWDVWERQSLLAAASDEALSSRIRAFWDAHFPVMYSVKTGYGYFAIEKGTHRVVHGLEPEFEEIGVVAESFAEFLEMVASGAERLRADI